MYTKYCVANHQLGPVSRSSPERILPSISENTPVEREQDAVNTAQTAVPGVVDHVTNIDDNDAGANGRRLRPRTYAQQHPVEYEYAKYLKMCRDTGMKPVPLYGFSSRNPVDKDFVPPVEHVRVEQQVTNFDEDTLIPSPKRRRVERSSLINERMRHGRKRPDHTDRDNSIFSFPADHWAENEGALPDLPEEHSTSAASAGVLTISEDSSDSQESETAAIARYRKKLKGVLPPSYLSKLAPTAKNPPPRILHASKQANVINGKGIARKKTSSRPALPIISLSPGSDSENELPALQIETSQMEPRGSEIIEIEEPIDRMLPTPPRTHRRKKQDRHRRRQKLMPPVYLQDVLVARPETVTTAMKIANRSVRRQSAGTQVHRKLFRFDKTCDRIALKRSLINLTEESGSEDEVEHMIRDWRRGQLPLRLPARKQKSDQAVRTQNRKGLSEITTDARPWQQKLNVRADPVSSRSRLSSSPTGFFLDDDDEEGATLPPARDVEAIVKRPVIPNLPSLQARTFSANLEHETGRFANTLRKTRPRKVLPGHLQSLNQIFNVFGEEPNVRDKVGEWQNTELPLASVNHELIERDDVAARIAEKRSRKRVIVRRVLKQTAIKTFTSSTEAPVNHSTFHFPRSLPDILLGAEPVHFEVHFANSTFVGYNILSHVLYKTPKRSTSCQLDGKTLRFLDFDTVEYGFTYLADFIDRTSPVVDLASKQREIHNFLSFAVRQDAPVDVLNLIVRRCDNIIRRLEDHGSEQHNELQTWLLVVALCCTSIAHQKHTDLHNAYEDLIETAFRHLLARGFEPVLRSLRRQRNQTNRAAGIQALDNGDLELWIVLVHITDRTDTPFWTRINALLELDRCHEQGIAERAWQAILCLSSVTQFSVDGRVSAIQSQNWHAVETLLTHVLGKYDRNAELPPLHRDGYIRVLLRRVHALAVYWRWPECSLILGRNRTGGALYLFFYQTLGLSDLVEAVRSGLPSFLHDLKQSSLDYNDHEPDSTFGIFLKLVCLGIKQYIEDIMQHPSQIERAKRRGIGVVDKFATHGRLNYPATHSIDKTTVAEIRNRFAVEIAVYWSAHHWKDRGVSRVIQAAQSALADSHLTLREINIEAWEIITSLQLQHKEITELPETYAWLATIIKTTGNDVSKFSQEVRANINNAKIQAMLSKDLSKCYDLLAKALQSYQRILTSNAIMSSEQNLYMIWNVDLISPMLCDHFSYTQRDNTLLVSAFQLIDTFVKGCQSFRQTCDSQDYGDIHLSQDECGTKLIDYSQKLSYQRESLCEVVFTFLTSLTARDDQSRHAKALARMGLHTFADLICATPSGTWDQYFNSRGKFSWYRLLDSPVKSVMLPYFLAILIKKVDSFYAAMQPLVISTWVSSLTQYHIKDSLCTLTNLLSEMPESFLYGSRIVESATIDNERIPLIISFLYTLGRSDNEVLNECLVVVASTLKHSLLSKNFRPEDVHMTQQVLACIHQYLGKTMGEAKRDFDWLSNPMNVPQRHLNFAADEFRAYAPNIVEKSSEATLVLLARCDTDLLENRTDLIDFLVAVLAESPLLLDRPPKWDTDASLLRVIIMRDLIPACRAFEGHRVAQSYADQLSTAMDAVYSKLREISSIQTALNAEIRDTSLPSISLTSTIRIKLSDWSITSTGYMHTKRNKHITTQSPSHQ